MKILAVPLMVLALLGCAAARRAELERLERLDGRGGGPEPLSERQKDMERLAGRIETPEEKARMAWLFLQLGRALRGAKRFDEALKVQRRVAQETEAGLSSRARLEMAETLREEGNHGGAMEVLRLLESSWDGRFALTARYHMALVELQRDRSEEALGLMEKAASGGAGILDPEERQSRSQAVQFLAHHFEKAGDLRKALRWWKAWDPYSYKCGTCTGSMIQERAIKVSEIHIRLGEIGEAVAELRACVAAGGFLHKPILAYLEAVGRAGNPAEESGKVDRLPEPGRRRCRAALGIREGLLAGAPQAVYAAPVEDLEYEAGGVVLGRMGDRAAEFLSFRILGGDLRAVRLAGWTALPSLVPALEARLEKEGDPGVRYEIRRSLSYLRNASPASR